MRVDRRSAASGELAGVENYWIFKNYTIKTSIGEGEWTGVVVRNCGWILGEI